MPVLPRCIMEYGSRKSSLTHEGLEQNWETYPVSRQCCPSVISVHLCVIFLPFWKTNALFFSTLMIKHGHPCRFWVCIFCILATIRNQVAYLSKNLNLPGREQIGLPLVKGPLRSIWMWLENGRQCAMTNRDPPPQGNEEKRERGWELQDCIGGHIWQSSKSKF